MNQEFQHWNYQHFTCARGPQRWHRGSGLYFGSGDLGSIPGHTLTACEPFDVKEVKTSSDVPVPWRVFFLRFLAAHGMDAL